MATTTSQAPEQLRDTVREKYGEVARSVLTLQHTSATSCCSPAETTAGASSCCSGEAQAWGAVNYDATAMADLPEEAVLASLGCGNPIALARLEPGQTVLDLGSGGGIDVLLSATRVGPEGFVYGLDMTDEMLELAERNKAAAGVQNVTFLKGQIENIPLPDNSVDVIISNCVINLSVDKPAVLREAYRVLKPGGQFAVSDVVIQGELASEIRSSVEAWAGCVAGAMEEHEYIDSLTQAGFEGASIEVTAVYNPSDVVSCCANVDSPHDGQIVSGFIRARKPE
ncbi:MAG TPA: arsenite methyltransferase [Thermomicrobiales bacterium]|nr:arsenite methyltransferase [Thermomicrobiales bacterium]